MVVSLFTVMIYYHVGHLHISGFFGSDDFISFISNGWMHHLKGQNLVSGHQPHEQMEFKC